LIINTMGDYAYTYRFTDDGGATYLYADLTGSQDGFQSGSLGSATILSSTPEPATALLLAFGLAGSAWVDRRRSR
jgi:hypothetical protein